VGTQNGLDKFDSKTGTFTAYTRRDGLPGNAVGCVLEDAHGILWMSTNNGIVRFDPESTAIRSYSTAEGLPGPDLTGWGACFKSRTGEMFFGGFNGATAFHPDSVVVPSNTPQVVLTELRLSGRPVDIEEGSPLSKSITYTPQLTLSHDQRIFSLAFSTLSFLSPGTNRYRYMLEGLDDTWHEVGSGERLATYTTLPSREYTFRVQGATSRGPWSEPGVRLRIDILPAWWNSWWFRATYIAVLLLILVTIYIYHQQQKKREAEHAEKLRRTQTELAQINRVSTMDELTASLAHEIKQPIGAAVTNAEACLRLLDRDQPDLPEAREAALEMARDARRAADIIEHVRSLFRKGSSPQEIVDVNEVIREMVVMLQKEASRHSVTMRTDLSEGLPRVMADRVQLQQALMNLMLNGLEAMGDTTGELSIKSQLGEGDQVLISVSDTGAGLPTENADEIFNAFFTTKTQGTGLGLAITRSIVESHGGRIWASANSGPGATFQFTLPLREAAGR
jgi:signal transduction histidine kinase